MKRGFLLKKVAAPQARTREKISEVQQLAAPQAAVQTSDVAQLAAPQTSVEVLGIAASKLAFATFSDTIFCVCKGLDNTEARRKFIDLAEYCVELDLGYRQGCLIDYEFPDEESIEEIRFCRLLYSSNLEEANNQRILYPAARKWISYVIHKWGLPDLTNFEAEESDEDPESDL